MKKLLAMVLAVLMMASIFTVAASADNEYAGEKLIIWTCLTADAQYEVLNKQFTELGSEMGVEVEVERLSFSEMIQKLATAASSGMPSSIRSSIISR